jgi:hypothetical protein
MSEKRERAKEFPAVLERPLILFQIIVQRRFEKKVFPLLCRREPIAGGPERKILGVLVEGGAPAKEHLQAALKKPKEGK